jgi:hypothetical protein
MANIYVWEQPHIFLCRNGELAQLGLLLSSGKNGMNVRRAARCTHLMRLNYNAIKGFALSRTHPCALTNLIVIALSHRIAPDQQIFRLRS